MKKTTKKKDDFDKKFEERDRLFDEKFDHDNNLERAISLSEAVLEDAILEIDSYFRDIHGGLTESEQKKYDKIKELLEKAYDKLEGIF